MPIVSFRGARPVREMLGVHWVGELSFECGQNSETASSTYRVTFQTPTFLLGDLKRRDYSHPTHSCDLASQYQPPSSKTTPHSNGLEFTTASQRPPSYLSRSFSKRAMTQVLPQNAKPKRLAHGRNAVEHPRGSRCRKLIRFYRRIL